MADERPRYRGIGACGSRSASVRLLCFGGRLGRPALRLRAKRHPILSTRADWQVRVESAHDRDPVAVRQTGQFRWLATLVGDWPVAARDAPASNIKEAFTMVKRRKEEEIVGVLEFAGKSSEDPEVMTWLSEHKAQNGGKIRVSRGSTGVRVAFSKAADMAHWKARSEQGSKGGRSSRS